MYNFVNAAKAATCWETLFLRAYMREHFKQHGIRWYHRRRSFL